MSVKCKNQWHLVNGKQQNQFLDTTQYFRFYSRELLLTDHHCTGFHFLTLNSSKIIDNSGVSIQHCRFSAGKNSFLSILVHKVSLLSCLWVLSLPSVVPSCFLLCRLCPRLANSHLELWQSQGKGKHMQERNNGSHNNNRVCPCSLAEAVILFMSSNDYNCKKKHILMVSISHNNSNSSGGRGVPMINYHLVCLQIFLFPIPFKVMIVIITIILIRKELCY